MPGEGQDVKWMGGKRAAGSAVGGPGNGVVVVDSQFQQEMERLGAIEENSEAQKAAGMEHLREIMALKARFRGDGQHPEHIVGEPAPPAPPAAQEPGEGSGDPAQAKPAGPEGEQQTPPAEEPQGELDGLVQRRLARQKSRDNETMEAKDREIEMLRRQLTGKGIDPDRDDEPEPLTEEPQYDDPKYAGNDDLFFEDSERWAQQGSKPAQAPRARDRHTGQFKSGEPTDPRQEAMNDYVIALAGADGEGELAAAFEAGVESGDIRVSDVVLDMMDDGGITDDLRYEVGRLFVNKPHVSRMIARAPASQQAQTLARLIKAERTAPPPPEFEPPAYWSPINGGGQEPAPIDFNALAGRGDMRAYRAARQAQGYRPSQATH